MLGARGVRPEIEFPLSPLEWGIFLFLSVHFPGIVCRFISFLSGRYYRPLSSFFSSCLGSGIGRLALRCPPSACGRLFATFRPLSLCHVSRGHKRQRPVRNVFNAGVAPAAREGQFTFGAASILSISRGCYPRLRPFPAILFGLCSFCRIVSGVSDYVPVAERELRLLVHFGRIFAAVFHFYLHMWDFCCTFAPFLLGRNDGQTTVKRQSSDSQSQGETSV